MKEAPNIILALFSSNNKILDFRSQSDQRYDDRFVGNDALSGTEVNGNKGCGRSLMTYLQVLCDSRKRLPPENGLFLYHFSAL
jgi:hypothetical protein